MLFSFVYSFGGTELRVVCKTAALECSALSLRTLQQSGCSFTQELESTSYTTELARLLWHHRALCLVSFLTQTRGSCGVRKDCYVNMSLRITSSHTRSPTVCRITRRYHLTNILFCIIEIIGDAPSCVTGFVRFVLRFVHLYTLTHLFGGRVPAFTIRRTRVWVYQLFLCQHEFSLSAPVCPLWKTSLLEINKHVPEQDTLKELDVPKHCRRLPAAPYRGYVLMHAMVEMCRNNCIWLIIN